MNREKCSRAAYDTMMYGTYIYIAVVYVHSTKKLSIEKKNGLKD